MNIFGKIAVLSIVFCFSFMQLSRGSYNYGSAESRRIEPSYEDSWESPSEMQEDNNTQYESGERPAYADSFTKPPVERGFLENLAIRVSNFFRDIRWGVRLFSSRVGEFFGGGEKP